MADSKSVDLSTPEAQAAAVELADEAIKQHQEGGNPTPETPETPATPETPEVEAAEEAAPKSAQIPVTEEVVEEVTDQLDMEALGQEYAADGALSEASRATVLAALTPKFGDASENVLNSYLAGIDAQVAQSVATGHEIAGGEESFNAMIAWAADGGLSDAEIDSYNVAVNTPGMEEIAARGLFAKYQAVTGTQAAPQPHRVAAPAVASAGGIGQINNMGQLSKLVSTREYATDAAHRAQVDAAITAAEKAGRI